MLITVLCVACSHEYGLVQSLDEPDSFGLVTWHLVDLKNSSVLLIKLDKSHKEGDVVNLTNKEIREEEKRIKTKMR